MVGQEAVPNPGAGSPALKVIAYLAPVLVVASIVTLAVLGSFGTRNPLCLALYVASVALAVWARTAFAPGTFRGGPPPGAPAVIRRGPYRFVRHPMYAAALLLIWTAIAADWSAATAVLGVVVTAAAIGRVIYEERLLRAALPDYADYARTTRALIPFIL